MNYRRRNVMTFLRMTWPIALALGLQTDCALGQQPADNGEAPGRARVNLRPGAASVAAKQAEPSADGRKKIRGSKSGKIVPVRHDAADESAITGDQAQDVPGEAMHDDDPLEALLAQDVTPIDLISALHLAGEQNPQVLLGQQRVVEAVALRQLAAAQVLPTINLGANTVAHWGVLQQSDGNILSLRREAVFVGAGANAVGSGTVNIPGVMWNLNVSDAIYDFLVNRQEVDRREFASRATRQDVLLTVALAYNDLVRSEGARSIALVSRSDAQELARITADYLQTGQGRKADADRTATEHARREAQVYEAQGNVVRASAALCQVLHLDPTIRLHAADVHVIPRSIVPDPIPLPELLALALLHRPELNERRNAVAQSLLALQRAKLLPFSPTLFLGFSAGGFGGGSDVAAAPTTSLPFGRNDPRFSSLDDREDLDVMAYWTLQNLGVGNKAQIAVARSRLSGADFELLVTLDRVRSEVAGAQARTHARFARISTACEMAITAATQAFAEDMERIKAGAEGLPLEAIDSLRLLARSRLDYLNAILDYNKAQFQLFVALGKPPAELLMRLPADEARRTARPRHYHRRKHE